MSYRETPLVSVLTPVYNNGDYMAECIESVLRQTYSNFEYIIVNNCSTDRTQEIAERYARTDSRIRVHNNTEFLGVIANHNHAFGMISPDSKYTKVVSGDDYIFPECLERMVELAEAHPSVGMVGSYSIAGQAIHGIGLEYERKVVSGHEVCRATLLGGPYVFGAPTALMYRSDLIRATPAYYPSASPHADTSACYRDLEHTDFGFVHQVISYTRIHPGSQTSRSLKFGTIKRATMSYVVDYGPLYLTRPEQDARMEFLLDDYYDWLAPAVFEQRRNPKFWQEQRAGLKELGVEFSRSRLWAAAASKAFRRALNPGDALNRLFAINRRDPHKIEAGYYR